ncbi:MAG: RtcB family protein [Candidatus Aenigmarchaeota archaeon]|nr:RtcB family protein [Candidatus Aenigmarchaeota archaeon]
MDISKFKRISEVIWELDTSFKQGMHVPARIYANENLLRQMEDTVVEQLTNVACLPGIQKHALCMPDGHSGYGFPIGGVAAFDPDDGGIISPGGIGFDINCGMRLMQTNLSIEEVKSKLRPLVDELFKTVPAGVGAKGFVNVSKQDFKTVVMDGVKWCVDNGYGWKEDLKSIEENGKIAWADTSKVSDRALERGKAQLGTLGSGNHYLEIQMVLSENIYDEKITKVLGIEAGKIVLMVHCGSRGFGHQIGTDYLKIFDAVMPKYGITVKDRELACAPFNSKEGQDYFGAMACAANLAFANRQVITHRIREAFSKVFQRKPEDMGLKLVYDVAHNIAKKEKYVIDGEKKELIVHRKGATRSFDGQPVIVGGSMETGSYLCIGTKKAEEETFGSTMHGSGRLMSRTQAKHLVRGEKLQKDMEAKGIYVKSVSMSGLAEEAGSAYKDISEVVETMDRAGISKKVVALKPLGNVKG